MNEWINSLWLNKPHFGFITFRYSYAIKLTVLVCILLQFSYWLTANEWEENNEALEPEVGVVCGRLGRNSETAANKERNWRLQVNWHMKPWPVYDRLTRVLHSPASNTLTRWRLSLWLFLHKSSLEKYSITIEGLMQYNRSLINRLLK